MLGGPRLLPTGKCEEKMTIYNAAYIAIFLGFIRKIVNKVTEDFGEGHIPYFNVDSEGCFCICVDDFCLGYSYDLTDARRIVREITEAIPMFSGRMKIVEDDGMEVADWRDIPGVTEVEMRVFRKIL